MGKYEADRGGSRKDDGRNVRQTSEATLRARPSEQQIASRRKAIRDQKIAIIVSCSVVLVLLVGLIIGMLLWSKGPVDDGKILPNVYAAGIDLGGMTKSEARSALHLATDKTFAKKDMLIQLPDSSMTLSPKDTGAKLDVEAVVEAAYSYGRTGSDRDYEKAKEAAGKTSHTIALLPYLGLDIGYIETAIEDFCDSYGSHMTQPSYELLGDRPAFDPEHPDLPVEHQTLLVTLGTPEYLLDAGKVYDRVLDAYSLNELTVVYEAPTRTEPEKLDAMELFQELCIAAEDATIDDVTFEITPEVYGYGFPILDLQERIDGADYGETVQIQLEFIMPDITAKALSEDLFVDLLSSFVSGQSKNATEGWNTNLELAAQAINGVVIKTGEEFSFNEVLGRPTAQKGYQKAQEFRNGKEVDVLGGGIGQVASTLYYCALMADLDILERHSNGYAVDHIELGLDACIDWGVKDMRWRNNTGSAIRVLASVEDGKVSVQLLGVDEREYRVEIKSEIVEEKEPDTIYQVVDKDNVYDYTDGQVLQEGISGYEVQTSMDKFDKQTGELLSSTLVDTSEYSKRDEIVVSISSLPEDPKDDKDDKEDKDPTKETKPTRPRN